jgi:secondary thiamine-phosphate synthase enzyme
MTVLTVSTQRRVEFVDVTGMVEKVVRQSGCQSGACLAYVPHTTAAVTINENADPSVHRDIQAMLGKLVPELGEYRHSEGNSDAHVKASLVGASQLIPVEEGRLALGTWQGVYFCEFDGPRTRRLVVQLLR